MVAEGNGWRFGVEHVGIGGVEKVLYCVSMEYSWLHSDHVCSVLCECFHYCLAVK